VAADASGVTHERGEGPSDSSHSGSHFPLAALSLLFFCSGTCALIYQILWLRMLGWVFGVTVYAASTVWAIFMAGLALGSFSAGLVADRVRNPLRWFGGAELLIGVTAAATPTVLTGLQGVYVMLYPSFPHTPAALTAARLVMAFAVLIVPTALMGATLPLVLKASTFRASALGRQVGLLYGSNAAGAILGTLAAGLYLIPQHGIHGTFLLAAGLNILVGMTAMALAGRVNPQPAARLAPVSNETARSSSTGESLSPPTERMLRVILVVFALSGAVALALEVVWFRVLTLFL